MFTGLVQAVGTVAEYRQVPQSLRLAIDPGSWGHLPELGASISINGVCLTVVERTRRRWSFVAVAETLAKTTLGGLSVGDPVNLEHAATAATLLGGHIVQGHVDGVGRVEHVQPGEDWRVWFSVPAELAEFLAPKGSICVNGVSLTIASIWKGSPDGVAKPRTGRKSGAGTRHGFSVALIPETLERTTLAKLEVGDGVNLEMDTIAKTVVHWLRHFGKTGTPRRKRADSSKSTRPGRRS